MEFITNQILLPLGGMFIAIFVGWFMKKSLITDEIGADEFSFIFAMEILCKIYSSFIRCLYFLQTVFLNLE